MGKRNMFCSNCGSQDLSVYFPTPEAVAREVVGLAGLKPGHQVLEPSAGTGNLARLCAERGLDVDCVEIQGHFAEQLQRAGLYRDVFAGDFLSMPLSRSYDRVIMNPPFERGQDMAHIQRGLGLLNSDGGVLVAIASSMTGRRGGRRDREFAESLGGYAVERIELPSGSFKSSGTNAECVVLRVSAGG